MGSKLWPIGTIQRHRHACVAAGVVIFWMTTLALVDLVSPRLPTLAIAAWLEILGNFARNRGDRAFPRVSAKKARNEPDAFSKKIEAENFPLRNPLKTINPGKSTGADRAVEAALCGSARAAALIDRLPPPRPVGLAQLRLQDLSRPRQRQRLRAERDLARAFVMGDQRLAIRDDRLRRRRTPRLQPHHGENPLAPMLVGHADDGAFGDVEMLVQRLLDFRGIDVLAARDD